MSTSGFRFIHENVSTVGETFFITSTNISFRNNWQFIHLVVTFSYLTSNSSIAKIVDNSLLNFLSKVSFTNSTPTMNMRINDKTFDNNTISFFFVVVCPDRSFNRFDFEYWFIFTPTSSFSVFIIVTISGFFGLLITTLGVSKLITSTVRIPVKCFTRRYFLLTSN